MLYRSFLTLAVLVGMAAVACADDAKPNTLTEQEKADGWVLLFDGESMDNFRNYKKDTIENWEVKDGAIVWTGRGGDIMTKDKYGSFELTLDYKISKGGNSGVMFHVVESDGPSYKSGPEFQIQDNVDGHDPQKAGWLYQFYAADEDATNPAGEWNTLRILITPEKCGSWMNGTPYTEFEMYSDDWDEKLAASKFADWPLFAKTWVGHICLQDHGNEVEFRNIKIRPLDDEYENPLEK